MTSYFDSFGERQPDKNEVHLPKCLSKEAIYKRYEDEMKQAKEPTLAISQFRDIWLKHFSHVKISTGKGGLASCAQCTNVKTHLLSTSASKESRKQQLTTRDEHLDLQALCRAKYYKHIKKAKEQPESYVSVIIDGMDQAKTRLPGFSIYSKVDAHLTKMQHHVTGVKVHSLQKSFIYTWTDVFHPDSNITINCLVDVLNEVSKANGGSMPPTLYLQADNSSKDNKNGFLMMFLAWLIKEKIFKKIKMNFLMVGHTHEDVDQMFSRIATHMSRKDVHTLPQLLHNMEQSFTPSPVVQHLKAMYDYKGQMMYAKGLIEGISSAHVFRFDESDGCIRMGYKAWPVPTEIYKIIDVSACIANFSTLRNCEANSKIDASIDKMKTDISKWVESGRLTAEEEIWWKSYLGSCVRETRLRPVIPRASELAKYALPQAIQNEDLASLEQAIDRYAEKERRPAVLRLKKNRIPAV